jgi:hypothetical protein
LRGERGEGNVEGRKKERRGEEEGRKILLGQAIRDTYE